MATASQRNHFRFDLGFTPLTLPDAQIDEIFSWAEARWTTNTDAVEAAARLSMVDHLISEAAKLVDYRANQSEEKLSQVFDHLYKWRKTYSDAFDLATTGAEASAVRWGSLKRPSPHFVEYPNDYVFPVGNIDISRYFNECGWL